MRSRAEPEARFDLAPWAWWTFVCLALGTWLLGRAGARGGAFSFYFIFFKGLMSQRERRCAASGVVQP
eukprot:2603972-Prymnesium_polylepis.1